MAKNRTREQLTKNDYEAMAALRYALRKFLRSAELNARTAGITSQQYQALLAIRGFPGREDVSIGELAERMQLLHHTTVELVDRMEALELVTRFAGSTDKRQVCVTLTSKGRQYLERVALANQEQLSCLAPDLLQALQQVRTAEKTGSEGEAHESAS